MLSIELESMEASAKATLGRARRGIDDALSRDRGRLHGLWSRWNALPGDAAAQAAFEQALAASTVARATRAATLPQAPVDPALPIATQAERIVELIRAHQVVWGVLRPAPRGGFAPATRPKPKQKLPKKEKQKQACSLPLVGTEAWWWVRRRIRKTIPEMPSAR